MGEWKAYHKMNDYNSYKNVNLISQTIGWQNEIHTITV